MTRLISEETIISAVPHLCVEDVVLGVQDFDSIRFATYRAACKLRFIQKKTNGELLPMASN